MIDLFDRQDGEAADWPLLAETLLLEAFHFLDKKPDDPRVLKLLRRTAESAYKRQTAHWAETLNLVTPSPPGAPDLERHDPTAPLSMESGPEPF